MPWATATAEPLLLPPATYDGVDRVRHRAVGRPGPDEPRGELVEVGLADGHGAGGQEALDRRGGTFRHVGVVGATRRRRRTGEVDVVLDGERNAPQRRVVEVQPVESLDVRQHGRRLEPVDPHRRVRSGGAAQRLAGDIPRMQPAPPPSLHRRGAARRRSRPVSCRGRRERLSGQHRLALRDEYFPDDAGGRGRSPRTPPSWTRRRTARPRPPPAVPGAPGRTRPSPPADSRRTPRRPRRRTARPPRPPRRPRTSARRAPSSPRVPRRRPARRRVSNDAIPEACSARKARCRSWSKIPGSMSMSSAPLGNASRISRSSAALTSWKRIRSKGRSSQCSSNARPRRSRFHTCSVRPTNW